MAPGDRRARALAGPEGRAHYHLVLLARDAEGYRNLIKLSSIGYTEGFYYRPRVDRETLARHSGGLIATSACMAGELARHLAAGRDDSAREVADWYANAFPDRYYLEVQAHGTEGQAELNQKVFALAEEMGLPVVATNDAHFLESGHHPAHDILVCIGTAKSHDDEDRLRYDGGLYLKSPEEMAEAFPGRDDVIRNTLKIADEVTLTLERRYPAPLLPPSPSASRIRTTTWCTSPRSEPGTAIWASRSGTAPIFRPRSANASGTSSRSSSRPGTRGTS